MADYVPSKVNPAILALAPFINLNLMDNDGSNA